MRRLVSAMCSFIVGSALVLACAQLATAADKELEGTWSATKAERDGRPAADVVGHRLLFSGDRFEIRSKDKKSLYSGTFRVDASAKPAAIDFEHAEGGLKGKTWKGIYVLVGRRSQSATMRLRCSQAVEIRGKERVWLCPGHV